MLMPKRTKRRKQHRGRMRGQAVRGNTISFGTYAMISLDPAWVTSRQIESARIAMTRHIKRGGKVWIRIFPDKPITKKPLEQRMGKGKAPVEGWVAVVKPGRVMFEMAGPDMETAKEAFRLAMHKMPMRCKFIFRTGAEADAIQAQFIKAKPSDEDLELQLETTEVEVLTGTHAEDGEAN